MRNVLELARDAAAAIGLEEITSLTDNSLPSSGAMRVLINRAGNNMARMRNAWGAGWTALTAEFQLELEPGEQEYQLPEDFQALIDGTLWDRSTYRAARGALSPQQWQTARSGLIETIALAPRYRIRRNSARTGKALFFDPIPTEERALVLEYISRNWLSDSAGNTFLNRIERDTDVPLLDDDLIEMDLTWRFRKSRGLTFTAELAEFEMERNRQFAEDAGKTTIPIGRRYARWGVHTVQGNWSIQ